MWQLESERGDELLHLETVAKVSQGLSPKLFLDSSTIVICFPPVVDPPSTVSWIVYSHAILDFILHQTPYRLQQAFESFDVVLYIHGVHLEISTAVLDNLLSVGLKLVLDEIVFSTINIRHSRKYMVEEQAVTYRPPLDAGRLSTSLPIWRVPSGVPESGGRRSTLQIDIRMKNWFDPPP